MSRSFSGSVIFFLLCAWILISSNLLAGAGELHQELIIINPDQDTYVTSTGINGLESYLVTRIDTTIYLRFPLSEIMSLTSANLEMHNYVDDVTQVGIYPVEDDSWDELTLNNENEPEIGELLVSAEILGPNWYIFDVTEFIKQELDKDRYATIAMRALSNTGKWQGESSEDSSNHPLLSINGQVNTNTGVDRPIAKTETTLVTETVTETTVETQITLESPSSFYLSVLGIISALLYNKVILPRKTSSTYYETLNPEG